MKKKALILCLLLTSASIVFFYSCGKNTHSYLGQQFSEDAIFRGIIFNEGEVANVIPQLRNNQIKPEDIFSKQEDIETVYDIRNKVMANIKQNDPSFLAHFKQEMTSGNTDRIEKAYRQASRKVYLALLEINNITSRQAEISFKKSLQDATKEILVSNGDGSLNRDKTQVNLKKMILDNSLHPIKESDVANDNCIFLLVVGVAVVVVVIAGVAVEAAAVTDTYAYVTCSESSLYSGRVNNKRSLYWETLIGEIATNLR